MAMLPNNTQAFLEEQIKLLLYAKNLTSDGMNYIRQMQHKSDEMMLYSGVEKDLVSKVIQDAMLLDDDMVKLQMLYEEMLNTLSQPDLYAPPESFRFRSTEE